MSVDGQWRKCSGENRKEKTAQDIRYNGRQLSLLLERTIIIRQRKEASIHKNAKNHACNVLWLLAYEPGINEFPGLIVECFCIKFRDPSWIGFWDFVQKNRQTHEQTEAKPNPRRRRGEISFLLYSFASLRPLFCSLFLWLFCYLPDRHCLSVTVLSFVLRVPFLQQSRRVRTHQLGRRECYRLWPRFFPRLQSKRAAVCTARSVRIMNSIFTEKKIRARAVAAAESPVGPSGI